MKRERVHRVPLCARALEILDEVGEVNAGSDYIFPGQTRGARCRTWLSICCSGA